jgi:hypothetical protein
MFLRLRTGFLTTRKIRTTMSKQAKTKPIIPADKLGKLLKDLQKQQKEERYNLKRKFKQGGRVR